MSQLSASALLDVEEIKKLEIDILEAYDAYCREAGLTYSLAYGTLLGAVRHQGFIPWDDDIDVMMLPEEYVRFQEGFDAYAEAHNLPYRLASTFNLVGDIFIPFEKIVDVRVRARSQYLDEKYKDYLWIDVFPLDNLAFPGVLGTARLGLARLNKAMFQSGRMNIDSDGVSTMRRISGKLGRTFKINSLAKLNYKQLERHRGQKKSPVVANLAFHWKRDVHPRAMMEDLTELSFEGKNYQCIASYDDYLERIYGPTYMELPPVEKRRTHECEAWWVDESHSVEVQNNEEDLSLGL